MTPPSPLISAQSHERARCKPLITIIRHGIEFKKKAILTVKKKQFRGSS